MILTYHHHDILDSPYVHHYTHKDSSCLFTPMHKGNLRCLFKYTVPTSWVQMDQYLFLYKKTYTVPTLWIQMEPYFLRSPGFFSSSSFYFFYEMYGSIWTHDTGTAVQSDVLRRLLATSLILIVGWHEPSPLVLNLKQSASRDRWAMALGSVSYMQSFTIIIIIICYVQLNQRDIWKQSII